MTTTTPTRTTTRAIIRGRTARKGETTQQLMDRLEHAVRALGFDSTMATVWSAANNPQTLAVELDVIIDVPYGERSLPAINDLIGRLPADLRLRPYTWS